jgi:NADPH:quinone reductase-like Zn-dependent oxidoreductase
MPLPRIVPTPCQDSSSASDPSRRSGPAGVTVDLRAAGLNHHDVWSLMGVGLAADRLPMILGCDGAGSTSRA